MTTTATKDANFKKAQEDNAKASAKAKADKINADKKTVHEKKIRDKNNKEMREAKHAVIKFQETKEFKALPEDVQSNIKRICGKTRIASATSNPFREQIKGLFPKLGTKVSELDIFMRTKMGRGEFRKKARELLKKSSSADRMWVEFDEDTESWELLQIGGEAPKKFHGKAI